jgi:hypothetical protein
MWRIPTATLCALAAVRRRAPKAADPLGLTCGLERGTVVVGDFWPGPEVDVLHGVYQTASRGHSERTDPVQRPHLDAGSRQGRRSLPHGRRPDYRRVDSPDSPGGYHAGLGTRIGVQQPRGSAPDSSTRSRCQRVPDSVPLLASRRLGCAASRGRATRGATDRRGVSILVRNGRPASSWPPHGDEGLEDPLIVGLCRSPRTAPFD